MEIKLELSLFKINAHFYVHFVCIVAVYFLLFFLPIFCYAFSNNGQQIWHANPSKKKTWNSMRKIKFHLNLFTQTFCPPSLLLFWHKFKSDIVENWGAEFNFHIFDHKKFIKFLGKVHRQIVKGTKIIANIQIFLTLMQAKNWLNIWKAIGIGNVKSISLLHSIIQDN